VRLSRQRPQTGELYRPALAGPGQTGHMRAGRAGNWPGGSA